MCICAAIYSLRKVTCIWNLQKWKSRCYFELPPHAHVSSAFFSILLFKESNLFRLIIASARWCAAFQFRKWQQYDRAREGLTENERPMISFILRGLTATEKTPKSPYRFGNTIMYFNFSRKSCFLLDRISHGGNDMFEVWTFRISFLIKRSDQYTYPIIPILYTA